MWAFQGEEVDNRKIAAEDWSVLLGVALGLALGKPIGIIGAALGAVAGKLASLPKHAAWRELYACAWLGGGLGFTMSLFIADLAFEGTPQLDSAKVGILAGSVIAGLGGVVWIRLGSRRLTPIKAS